jgi:hypothetical protein
MKYFWILLVSLLSFCAADLPAQTGASAAADWMEPASVMRGCIERYGTDYDAIDRSYGLPISQSRSERLRKLYNDYLSILAGLSFEPMSQEDKVDYILFKNYLSHELRQLALDEKKYAEEQPLIPFAKTISDLEDARLKMKWVDGAGSASMLTELNTQIAAARKELELSTQSEGKKNPPKFKKTVANRAASRADDLRSTLKHWFNFYNGYDPLFTWWAGEPYKSVDQSLKSYADFLRTKLAGLSADDDTTIIGNPIGREAIMTDLASEMIPYTPEELIDIANKEFAWCDAEMKKASKELGYGDDWHKALEHVKTLHVEPGKQPGLVKELADEAVKFVEDHDLVTVPELARDSWHMEMLSPEQQQRSPFFLGGEDILVAFPTNTMTQDQKMMTMRGNNIHFSRATVFHELIPGHHLQWYMNSRYRTYRGLFSTPFWTEGWSLYWEMLFWDLDFPKTPENKIGMLFWRMHRCARIIFSLNFHLEKMTPQECINFLVERVGHERANAAAEVRRSFNGGYGPLYQCAYMLGALQFRALHRDLVESGKMTNRQFHDTILRENNIPIEMVRALLTNQPLSKDFATSWKFYGR